LIPGRAEPRNRKPLVLVTTALITSLVIKGGGSVTDAGIEQTAGLVAFGLL